jgi:hypothetical protein
VSLPADPWDSLLARASARTTPMMLTAAPSLNHMPSLAHLATAPASASGKGDQAGDEPECDPQGGARWGRHTHRQGPARPDSRLASRQAWLLAAGRRALHGLGQGADALLP